ncbi:MAG TPA: hypothetical protein VNJ12_13205 [Candidatus Dormibacteraeota bacterium]|nr:hypothetical protein [Candidatus Dormibacteraeota bacterium]
MPYLLPNRGGYDGALPQAWRGRRGMGQTDNSLVANLPLTNPNASLFNLSTQTPAQPLAPEIVGLPLSNPNASFFNLSTAPPSSGAASWFSGSTGGVPNTYLAIAGGGILLLMLAKQARR